MAKMTLAQRENFIRQQVIDIITDPLDKNLGQVLVTGSGKRSIPVLDPEGNECFAVIQISVPRGSRDGTPYDGYAEAEAYAFDLAEKAEAARAKAAIKAREEALKAKRAEERRMKRQNKGKTTKVNEENEENTTLEKASEEGI